MGTSGRNWEFDGTDKVESDIWDIIKSNHYGWSQTFRDKKNFTVMFYAQGKGTGKSRTLSEISKMEPLIEKVKGLGFEHTMHINIAFDKVTSPAGKYRGWEFDYITNMILFHLIGDKVSGSNTEGFPEFCRRCANRVTLDEILGLAATKFATDGKKVALFLMVDSLQKVGDGSGGRQDPLQEVVRYLAALLQSSYVFIILVISATERLPLADALQDCQPNYRFLQTPALTDLPKRNGKYIFDDTVANRALFNLTHKHPRTVESLEQVLSESPDASLEDVMESVMDKVGSNYGEIVQQDVETSINLLRLSVLQTPVRDRTIINGVPLANYLRFGLMHIPKDNFYEEGKLILSPFWLCLFRRSHPTSILAGWDWHSSIRGESWELFTSWYRCLLSKVHPEGPIKLKDLHNGMQFTEGGDIEVMNRPLSFEQSMKQLGTKSDQTATNGKLIGNGKGDFFCTLDQVKPVQQINEVTQCHVQESGNHHEKERMTDEKIRPANLITDHERSCNEKDIFMLMTNERTQAKNKSWEKYMKGKLFGVVDCAAMDAYFGPFALFYGRITKPGTNHLPILLLTNTKEKRKKDDSDEGELAFVIKRTDVEEIER